MNDLQVTNEVKVVTSGYRVGELNELHCVWKPEMVVRLDRVVVSQQMVGKPEKVFGVNELLRDEGSVYISFATNSTVKLGGPKAMYDTISSVKAKTMVKNGQIRAMGYTENNVNQGLSRIKSDTRVRVGKQVHPRNNYVVTNVRKHGHPGTKFETIILVGKHGHPRNNSDAIEGKNPSLQPIRAKGV